MATPPEDRHPILSFVGPRNDKQIAAAIRRELLREGQVFFVLPHMEGGTLRTRLKRETQLPLDVVVSITCALAAAFTALAAAMPVATAIAIIPP